MEEQRATSSEPKPYFESPDLIKLRIPRWKRLDELFVMHLLHNGADVEICRDGVWDQPRAVKR